ncbi:MAG: TIGR03915 family putative DNA repair protein, partial [Halioglobus sp.]
MEQDSLFSTPDTSGQVKTLTFFPSFEAWRNEARMPLQRGIEPHACEWLADKSLKNGSQDGWQDGSQDDNRDTRYAKRRETAGKMSCVKIPSEFVQLGRAAACHRNPDRWALLYSVAWRILHRQPHLLDLASDPEVVKLHRYAKAVARDAHKMKAFVRFRSVSASGELGAKEPSDTELVVKEPCCKKEEPRYVAWFEPEHFIVEFVSGFFQRRFTNMAWSILTPYGCV